MRSPFSTRRPLFAISLTATLVSISALFLTIIALSPTLLVGWYADREFHPSLPFIAQRIITEATSAIGRISPFAWLTSPVLAAKVVVAHVLVDLDQADLLRRLEKLIQLSLTNAGLASLVTWGLGLAFSSPKDRLRHRRGRRLLSGYAAIRAARQSERRIRKETGDGLILASGLPISRERETRHFMLVGGTGSGKTVLMRGLQKQILDRKDRIILHDTKGDVLETLPLHEHEFLLLAPQDQRSAAWDIAADILTEQDAIEFAAALIPESKERIWADGARLILAGCIVHLILEHDGRPTWSWADLANAVFAPPRELNRIIRESFPMAISFVQLTDDGGFDRTASSFLATLKAHSASVLIPLSKAWGRPSAKRFSIRAYLADDLAPQRAIVLQRAPHLPHLSESWIGAFIRCASNLAVGPILRDDSQRRIWLMLDEFPQLGKLEGFHQIIEKGRSRGICVILGLQDLSQLNETYGAEIAQTWISSIGTKIILRMSAGDSANTICSDMIGKRLVDWDEESMARAPWQLHEGSRGTTRTNSVKSQELEVVSPAFLESEVGRIDTIAGPVIRGLVIGIGPDVLHLAWTIPAWPALRPPTMPAEWNK